MLRYSLRTLLVGTAIIAILLANSVNRAKSQKRGRDWVALECGHVSFAHSYDRATRTYDHSAKLWTPSWLVDLLGVDFFDSVDAVILDNQEVDDLEPITDLQSLRSFAIMIEITDDLDFAPRARLPDLEEVHLDYTNISAERLAGLRRLLPRARVTAANHPPPP